MARVNGRYITYNDLQFMVSDEGIPSKQSIPSGKGFVRKDELFTLVQINEDNFAGINNNIFSRYDLIEAGIFGDINNPYSVPYTANSFSFSLIAPNGYNGSDNATWISFTPADSLTSEIINVNITLNSSTSSRSGQITFTDPQTSQSFVLTINQAANPGVATSSIFLRFGSTSALACNASTSLYYIPQGQTFNTATALYSNSTGTNFAASGYYSNGTEWRLWNGTSFTLNGICGF